MSKQKKNSNKKNIQKIKNEEPQLSEINKDGGGDEATKLNKNSSSLDKENVETKIKNIVEDKNIETSKIQERENINSENDKNIAENNKDIENIKIADNKENTDNKKEDKNKKDIKEGKVEEIKKELEISKEKYVTDLRNKDNKEAKKKRKIIYIVLAIVIFILAVFSVIFSLININNNDIMDGVSIKGINVSGMSKEEAKQNIEKVTTEKLLKTIKLVDGDYKVDLNPKDIEATFNVDKAVEEAYNIGRDGNIIVNNYKILMAKLFKKDINLDFSLNEERLLEIINDTSLKLPGTVVQSSYYIEDDELIITKGTAGERIKTEELRNEIYNNIEDLNIGDTNLQIPTEIVDPEPIDVEKIRNEIYKEPKDAYVTKNPTEVHTHVNGVDFAISIEEAKKNNCK